jgi:hypothetical protein
VPTREHVTDQLLEQPDLRFLRLGHGMRPSGFGEEQWVPHQRDGGPIDASEQLLSCRYRVVPKHLQITVDVPADGVQVGPAGLDDG